jgi:hypothetical protein
MVSNINMPTQRPSTNVELSRPGCSCYGGVTWGNRSRDTPFTRSSRAQDVGGEIEVLYQRTDLPSTETNLGAQTQRVWMKRSSIVYWAYRGAFARPGGRNIGFHNWGGYISWFCQRGMTWAAFSRTIDSKLNRYPPPIFIMIQLGSNDLGFTKNARFDKQYRMWFITFWCASS